jgi:hypothetical protein
LDFNQSANLQAIKAQDEMMGSLLEVKACASSVQSGGIPSALTRHPQFAPLRPTCPP